MNPSVAMAVSLLSPSGDLALLPESVALPEVLQIGNGILLGVVALKLVGGNYDAVKSGYYYTKYGHLYWSRV
jgi:hypothetical protein